MVFEVVYMTVPALLNPKMTATGKRDWTELQGVRWISGNTEESLRALSAKRQKDD